MARLLSFFTHKVFKILLSLYLGLFLLIWLISSPVTKHFLTPVLSEQQLHLADEASISFNPFLMRVTLSDIKISVLHDPKKEVVFSLQELALQVDLWQLAFDKIVLSKFTLDQGTLKVTQGDDYLVIAGIKIPTSEKAKKEAEEKRIADMANESTEMLAEAETDELDTNENAEKDVNTATTSLPYQLVLPSFVLNDFHIEIEKRTQEQKNKTHHITIEQFALSQIKATEKSQEGNLTLTALVDQTQLALSANTLLNSGIGDIRSNIRLSNYPIEKLSRYVEQLTELNGTLSFDSNQTISLAEKGTSFKVQKASLKLQDLLMGIENKSVTLKSFEHNFRNLALDLQDGVIVHLTGSSNIKLTDAAVTQDKGTETIAAFTQLNLADINFVLDEEPSIDISNIVLDGLLFSKKATLSDKVAQEITNEINEISAKDGVEISAEALVKLPPVMQLKQLTLNNLHIHQQSIAINSIILDSLSGAIIIQDDKSVANLVVLGDESKEEAVVSPGVNEEVAPSKPAAPNDKVIEETASENAFTFSLQELRFVNENAFDFTDFSVAPVYQRTLYIDTLDLGAISNTKDKQEEQTPFTLIGRSNKYANFNLTGWLQPFATLPSYHTKGDFKEFSLPAISTYLKGSTGIEVKTGQLDTGLDLTLAGEELDGNVVILIKALETGIVDSEEAGNLIDQGALPLNMAMGMLKDSDGNVELDVPLSGSTSDPSFGLSSIVTLITKKAIYSATQDYIMTTFVPYANIVSIAMTAGEMALKLRFEDLEYEEKQIEPNQKQSAYLKEFIALMQDKKDARVTICAISTPADIDRKSGTPITDKGDIKKLIELGEKREHAFKDYLIEQGKIDSSRILFCSPQIDSDKGAKPRIAISV